MINVLLSHPGKQHSYHVAKSLNDLGYLEKFYTSTYIKSQWLQNFLNKSKNNFWSRRFLDTLHGDKVEANWIFEVKEILYSKLLGQTDRTLQAVYQRDMNFDRYIARRMGALKGGIFWGFQGSSFASLQAAKREGKIAICELATAHAPAALEILGEEVNLHPDWADSFDNVNFPAEYYERLCEEPHQADYVVGASSFTLKTLRKFGVPEQKLKYLPLGVDLMRIQYNPVKRHKNKPLRLLFAGRITQRKGIKYLLEAVERFSSREVELHIIGNIQGSGAGLKNFSNYVLHPAVSQQKLFTMYADFDAFVLPSVFEGFGLVIVEAMAAGLPVITTEHTIGPELINHGNNGFLVPVRDSGAIENAIAELLKKSPDELSGMRQKARESALLFGWSGYTDRLKVLVDSL